MKKILFLVSLCYLAAGCGSAVGKIELYDSSASRFIDSNAKIEIIGRNYKWSEGPVWVPGKKMLLFSAVLENRIYKWNGVDSPAVYLSPSGYTDTAYRGGENGSNGLALDKDGNLLLCQSGNRQVVRLNTGLKAPRPDFAVLASNYEGKRFNSPNDLVADSRNNIYFTDPVYGLPKRAEDPTRELNFEGVYKISSDGTLSLLIDSIPRPNGIALSADEKILYVGSSDDRHTGWYAYHLDANGNIQSGGLLFDGTALKEKATVKQGADGFKVDKYGNIFGSGPDGVNIISPAGKLLGLIKVFHRPTSNCAFNETKDVLYITADDVVLRVRLRN
ncbi:MAG TPA: SMP-30/gluconolactonase/LRE family protein [Puia sp.]|jgi:gluconolactonase